MAEFDTYAKLRTKIQSYLNKNNASTVAEIPGFIELAEADMRLAIVNGKATQRARAILDGQYLALPQDFGGLRGDIKLVTNPERLLRYETPDRLTELYQSDITGLPQKFTIQDQQFRFAPYGQGDNIEVEITYYMELTALSDANPSNWLLLRAPGAYLYGSLIHASGYVTNPEKIPVWQVRYDQAMNSLGIRDKHDRWSSGPMVARPRSVA